MPVAGIRRRIEAKILIIWKFKRHKSTTQFKFHAGGCSVRSAPEHDSISHQGFIVNGNNPADPGRSDPEHGNNSHQWPLVNGEYPEGSRIYTSCIIKIDLVI